jgi:hypothetical protein
VSLEKKCEAVATAQMMFSDRATFCLTDQANSMEVTAVLSKVSSNMNGRVL